MEVLSLPRRAGKTSTLLRRCYEHDGIIVCSTGERAKEIEKMAKDAGMNMRIETSTFRKFIAGELRGHAKPVFIDDAEFLCNHFSDNIRGITVTPCSQWE